MHAYFKEVRLGRGYIGVHSDKALGFVFIFYLAQERHKLTHAEMQVPSSGLHNIFLCQVF